MFYNVDEEMQQLYKEAENLLVPFEEK